MMEEQEENWKNQIQPERKGQVCINLPHSLMEGFKKKYPKGNFSLFVTQKLRDELK